MKAWSFIGERYSKTFEVVEKSFGGLKAVPARKVVWGEVECFGSFWFFEKFLKVS
jgi:hypothetical protein